MTGLAQEYGSTDVADENRLLTQAAKSQETGSSTAHAVQTTSVSFFDNIKSIRLENTGTVARDHMANERTFLAWLRTSLSFISLGIGVTQLFRLNGDVNRSSAEDVTSYGKPLGSGFIILGIITLLFGFARFFQVQSLLTRDHFPALRLFMYFLIGSSITLILVSFGIVIRAT